MLLRIYIISIILFQSLSMNSQEIFHADYSNKYNSFKNINESKLDRTFIQLILYADNNYSMEQQIYFNNKFLNKKRIVNCFKNKGIWKIDNNKIILISNGFNNIINFRINSNKQKMFLIEQNLKLNKHIKFKKVSKSIVEIDCNYKDSIPVNDLN